MILVFLILFGGFLITKSLFPEKFPGSISQGSRQVGNQSHSSTTSATKGIPAPTATKTAIVVNSQPGGAEVYLNNKPTGVTTPGRVQVPADQPFNLMLVKEGYSPYTHNNLDLRQTNQRSLRAVLQRQQNGYIDIDVRPSRSQSRIFINGVELQQKPPISKHPVPANQWLEVIAINSANGQRSKKRLSLRPNQRKSILLQFTSSKRSRTPSNRRRR
jgi:hypothetical protein